MDGWNTGFLLRWPIFRGYVSFRECNSPSAQNTVPFQEVFRPLKPAQNTLSEGSWSTRVDTTSLPKPSEFEQAAVIDIKCPDCFGPLFGQASLYYPFGGNQIMQIYGNFHGFSLL